MATVSFSYVVAAPGAPGAPTDVVAVAGDGRATVSFNPPASDGGSAITGYTVTASPEGITGTGEGSPIVVTGLTNGVAYTFTVTATNSEGPGPASDPSVAITPTVQFPIVANFDGATDGTLATAGWLLSGDAAAADDRLRLTRAVNVLAGTAIFNKPFVSTVGVNVQFDYEMSGGTGADGLAFFLVDGAQASPTSGGSGPSFGYVYGDPGVAGASQAYLGVGFDLWGNFTRAEAFHDGTSNVENPNHIALRGPATRADSSIYDEEYDYVVGSAVAYNVGGTKKVNLTITPDGHITLFISADEGATWTEIYSGFNFAGTAAFSGYTQPAMLKLGFGASTGGSNNVHAIDNVVVRKPANHTIAFTSTPTNPQNAGDSVDYTITMSNAGWNDDPEARLVYTVPAELTDVSWTYVVDGGDPITGTSSSIDEVFGLAAGKSATLVVEAKIALSAAGTTIAHSVSITPSEAFGDLAPANNIATADTAVTPTPAITSSLTADGAYRDEFTYTITASNSPTSFGATGLPTGLSLNASTGEISGAPTQAGEFEVELTGTNASGTGVASTLAITVAKAPLTVTASNRSREYGVGNPTFALNYAGFLGGDTAASLTTAPIGTSVANSGSSVGTYAITVAGGVSANYTFTYVGGTLTIYAASQSIDFASISPRLIGESVALSASATSGLPVSFSVVSGPATIAGSTLTATGIGSVTVRASQSGNSNYDAASDVDRTFTVSMISPEVTTPTQETTPPAGGNAELSVGISNPNTSYQWQRNGQDLVGGAGAALTLSNVQPSVSGLYTYRAKVGESTAVTSEPAIVGVTTTDKIVGEGAQVLADVVHPNGNVYDQILLEGKGAAITANPNKITRISFIDLSNDIVQVEFSGAGTLSVVMDGASTPSPASNYNQPGVDYVKGHVGLVIVDANETSNLSVISVGRITAVNQTLFKEGVAYDGVADIAFVAIQSMNGKFGGIRTGNVSYYASQGFTGVYAPGVDVVGPVNIGEVSAFDSATPILVFGEVGTVNITGGSLNQPNGNAIMTSGIGELKFVDGTTSQGVVIPAQSNEGQLLEEGVDVTDLLVTKP